MPTWSQGDAPQEKMPDPSASERQRRMSPVFSVEITSSRSRSAGAKNLSQQDTTHAPVSERQQLHIRSYGLSDGKLRRFNLWVSGPLVLSTHGGAPETLPFHLKLEAQTQNSLPEAVGRLFGCTILSGDTLRTPADMWCRLAMGNLLRAGAVVRRCQCQCLWR